MIPGVRNPESSRRFVLITELCMMELKSLQSKAFVESDENRRKILFCEWFAVENIPADATLVDIRYDQWDRRYILEIEHESYTDHAGRPPDYERCVLIWDGESWLTRADYRKWADDVIAREAEYRSKLGV